MAWWYNNRKKLKEGRPWIDDNGVKHRYNWIKWSDLTKKIHGLTWEAEIQPASFESFLQESMSGALAQLITVVEAEASK